VRARSGERAKPWEVAIRRVRGIVIVDIPKYANDHEDATRLRPGIARSRAVGGGIQPDIEVDRRARLLPPL
jgi:hypothetical protein